MMSKDIKTFDIQWKFFDDSKETEVSMFVGGENILAFQREDETLTTRWNLEDLVFWLRDFVDNMKEEPYPVEVHGDFASIKDVNSREFDCEDESEFDAYYDALEAWNLKHRWHRDSGGAILADLYFQQVGDCVEISWNNTDCEEGVTFKFDLGGAYVLKEDFCTKVNFFLNAYADHWLNPTSPDNL